MPQQTFEITAPNGKTLEVTGDRVPTEAELQDIFAKVGGAGAAPATTASLMGRAGHALQQVGQGLVDVNVGALKGVSNTIFGLGKAVHDYTPIGRVSDAIQPGAFDQRPPDIVPTNAAQKVGYLGEQAGEFFLPTGAAGKLGKAAEAVKSGALTLAQTGSPVTAGISAGLSAVVPGLGAARQAIAGNLETSAEKNVSQALGASKERFKAIAERLTPEILKRGLYGSREALQAKAAATLETVGDQLDTALQQFGQQQVGTAPIMTALETAKDAFRTTNAAGTIVEFEPRAIRQLGGLQKVIADLGPDATVEQLVAVRRAWDKVVSQAGGFAQRAGGAIGVPLKDQSEAWAKREATGAIRKVLDTEVPDLAAINKEWSFWKNLDDVLTQTLQRTQPQGPGLLRQGAEFAGQVVGGAAGGTTGGPAGAIGGAFAVGKLAKMAQSVFTSPRWRLASAQMKNTLAEALVNGKPSAVADALARISTATPSAVYAATGQGK